uniref:OTU domain-containing protein n=1 Tax=Amorphochlora amoebiformis TaxID=1561963 RepID=A0A7S0DRE7_9EUKA
MGDVVDANYLSEWRSAKIVAITASQFRIEYLQHFEGRVKREFIRKNHERLAAAGTHVAISQEPVSVAQPAGSGAVAAAPPGQAAQREMVEGFGITLEVGSKCDCLDQNKWRLATVVEKRDNDLKVHYEGWSERWDEWVRAQSHKLQPRDSMTGGAYTGDPKRRQQQIPEGFFDPVVAVDNTPKQWKRVLSHGLSDPQIKQLDSIFEAACKLQDTQRSIVLGRPHDIEKLQKDLTDFKAKISKTAAGLPPSARAYLGVCNNIVSDVKSTLSETLKQKRQQQLLSNEDKYFKKLQKSFYFVKIPSDGNCLFAATGRGMRFAEKLAECKHNGEIKSLVAEARRVSNKDSSEIATDQRLQAVMHIQNDAKYAPKVANELKHAVQTVQRSGGNPTSKTIVQQLKAVFQGQDLMTVSGSSAAVGVYCQVMMSPRIFGTELEAQALSEVLQAPLHIYYRVTTECETEEELKATKIIGKQFEGKKPPVHLAFYMGKTHYDLLIKKHPNPDPVEVKAKMEREEKRKLEGFRRYRFVITGVKGGEEAKKLELSQIRFFKESKWIMPPHPRNPGGHSPPNNTSICLIDGAESSKMIDLNFKKNKKTVLVYDFEQPTVVTNYELWYSDESKCGPISWTLYGDSVDGSTVLDEKKGVKAEGKAARGKTSYFVLPKPEANDNESKSEGKEGSSEGKSEEKAEGKSKGNTEAKSEIKTEVKAGAKAAGESDTVADVQSPPPTEPRGEKTVPAGVQMDIAGQPNAAEAPAADNQPAAASPEPESAEPQPTEDNNAPGGPGWNPTNPN